MAANTDLGINIATTLDATGLRKADSAVKRLDKTVSKLGRNLGLTLGTTALVSYGKAAVKAFAADEAAARRLATAVDNLGLSFSQAKVTDFIAGLEQSAAIADDILRPAFQTLLTTTGSLTQSQKLLNDAIQISRASGVDLATVATDLGKGYVGITRGLTKYNTGLTRAEITTKSFNEILGIMLARSAGAAQDYLTTTSYKMEVLTTAAGNAQETIGSGLVDAFAKIGGGSSATDAAKTIDTIAQSINTLTQGVGFAIGGLIKFYKTFSDAGKAVGTSLSDNVALFGQFAGQGSSTNRSASPAGTARRTAQQRQAEATAAKRAKELAVLQTKQVKSQKALTAEQKKQATLKKAGTIFDLEQIQIIAALKGQLSEDDRKRVELQLALLTGNTKEATKLATEIAKAQGLGKDLAAFLASLPNAKNPFEAWSTYLDEIMKKAALAASASGAIAGGGAIGTNFMNSVIQQSGANVPIQTNVIPMPKATSIGSDFMNSVIQQAASNKPVQVTVQIDGKAVASSLRDSSLSGIGSFVDRVSGG
jgi:hypothetical protein